MCEPIISEKFSMDDVFNMMKSRSEEIFETFDSVFCLALFFLPNIIIPTGLNNSIFSESIKISVGSAKKELKKIRESVKRLFQKHDSNLYYKKYNNIVLANSMLIFASFFDAMSDLIPDEEYSICLTDSETISISQKKFMEYIELIGTKERTYSLDNISVYSNLIIPYHDSLIRLEEFYSELTNEFRKFFDNLSIFEKLSEAKKDLLVARINSLPKIAVRYYKADYIALKSECSFYKAYADTEENQYIINEAKAIKAAIQDFKIIHTPLDYSITDKKVESVLNRLDMHYENVISTKILYGDSKDDDEFSMLPILKDIFVPQAYKSLVFKKGTGIIAQRLEPEKTWKGVKDHANLAEYIQEVLNNPVFGRKPLVILGNPGAGKSTLCYMLAAKILKSMYHTIVIRLREVNANDHISSQIEQQVYKDLDTNCSWSDIRDSLMGRGTKPLLLIFDGYDELLQASGKEYRNYIRDIQSFQRRCEKDYGFFIKAIITSRRTLIDTADIGNNSVVLNLCDFDQLRIENWISIWNEKNKKHFIKNSLNPFEISEKDNCYILAKQPLLLTLLALYDFDDNALKKNKNLDITQLYERLIRDFIEREKNKDRTYRNKSVSDQKKDIEDAYLDLNIASIGMYNRNSIILSSEEFIKDIKRFKKKEEERSAEKLNRGLQTFSSFFFVNTSQSTEETKRNVDIREAYEFLHNTFGEFLAGDYILKQCCSAISYIRFDRSISLSDNWYLCLAYVPLFTRYNIVNMIKIESKHKTELFDKEAFNHLIKTEVDQVISGEIIYKLREKLIADDDLDNKKAILYNAAVYSINIITLAGVIFESEYMFKISEQNWYKLLYIWRYAFEEDELLKFVSIIDIRRKDDMNIVLYRKEEKEESDSSSSKIDANKLSCFHVINKGIADEINSCLTGSLLGDLELCEVIRKKQINALSNCTFSYLLRFNPANENYSSNDLLKIQSLLQTEKDDFSLYILYNFIIRIKEKKRNNITNKKISAIVSRGLKDIPNGYWGISIVKELIKLSFYINMDNDLFYSFTESFSICLKYNNPDSLNMFLRFFIQNINYVHQDNIYICFYYLEKTLECIRSYIFNYQECIEYVINISSLILQRMNEDLEISIMQRCLEKVTVPLIKMIFSEERIWKSLSVNAIQDLIICIKNVIESEYLFSNYESFYTGELGKNIEQWCLYVFKKLPKYPYITVEKFLDLFLETSRFEKFKYHLTMDTSKLLIYLELNEEKLSIEILKTIYDISKKYQDKKTSEKVLEIVQKCLNELS